MDTQTTERKEQTMFQAHETGPEAERAREFILNQTLPGCWDDPAFLEAMPTISAAQADDLKFDDTVYRVWLSRVTKGGITVEKLTRGRWEVYWSNHEAVAS